MSGRTSKRTKGGMLKKGILGSAMLVLLIGMIGLLSINTTGTTTGSVGHALMPQHTASDGLSTYMNDDGSVRSVFGLNLQDGGDGDTLIEVEFTLTQTAGAFDPTTDLADIAVYFDDSAPQGEYDSGDNALTDSYAIAGTGPWTVTVTVTGGSWAIPDTDNGNDAGLDFFVCFLTNGNVDEGDKFTCDVATDGVTVTGPTTITTNAFTSHPVVIDITDPALPPTISAESDNPDYLYTPGLDGVRSLPGSEEKVYYNNMPEEGLHQRVWINWTVTEAHPYRIDYDFGNDNAFNEDLPDTMHSNDAVLTYMLSWNENGMTEGPWTAPYDDWGHRLVTTRMTDLAGNTADYEVDFIQDNDDPDIMTEGQFGGSTRKTNSTIEWFYPYDDSWDAEECWLNGVYHVNESNYFVMAKEDPLFSEDSGGSGWSESAGVELAQYSIDGGGWVDFTGVAADADIGSLAPGEHIITYHIMDQVGNLFERTDTVVVAKYIGDYTVGSNMVWSQDAYLCNGNVTIDPTFQMDLIGTLFMNQSADGDHWIHNDGTFKVRDGGIVTNLIDPTIDGVGPCAFDAGDFGTGFYDMSYGFTNADGSTLSLSNGAMVERAVEIYSEGAVNVGGSTVQLNDLDGIRADCSVYVYGGSIIDSNGDDGLDVSNVAFGELKVLDSNVTNNADNGILMDNASGYVLNSNIMGNGDYGFYLDRDLGSCNVSVEGSNISNNDIDGVVIRNSYYMPENTPRGNSEVLWSGYTPEWTSDPYMNPAESWDDANYIEFEMDLSGISGADEVTLSFWNWYWGEAGDYGAAAWWDETQLRWWWMTSFEGWGDPGNSNHWFGNDYDMPSDTRASTNRDMILEDGWVLDSFYLTGLQGWANPIPVRLYWVSDGDDVSPGWFLDDVYLTVDGQHTILRNWETTGGITDPRLQYVGQGPASHWDMAYGPKSVSYPSNDFRDTVFWDNEGEGIDAQFTNRIYVDGCDFRDTTAGHTQNRGIVGNFLQDITVMNSNFIDLPDEGLYFQDDYVDLTAHGNTFMNIDDQAILIDYASDFDIQDNVIKNGVEGILIEEAVNWNAHTGDHHLITAHNIGLDQTVTLSLNLATTTNPVLSYWDRCAHYASMASVEVSTDGGATWTQVQWYDRPNEADRGHFIWTNRFVDLSNYTGQSNVLVKFNYVERGLGDPKQYEYGDLWALDDIKVQDYTPVVNYQTDFEDLTTEDGWTTYGWSGTNDRLNSPWEHGTLDTDYYNDGPLVAYSGTSLWGTELYGDTWDEYTSYLQTPAIDLSGYAAGDLVLASFWEWLETDDSASEEQSYILVSSDGLEWQPIRGWPEWNEGGNNDLDVWHPVTLDVSQWAGTANFQMRFLLESNSVDYAGWYIDDFSVKTLTPVGSPLINEGFEGPADPNVDYDFWFNYESDGGPLNPISNNVITGMSEEGIQMYHGVNTLIEGNTINDCRYGVYMTLGGTWNWDSYVNIKDNDLTYNRDRGVYLYPDDAVIQADVTGNDFSYGNNGLYLYTDVAQLYVNADDNVFHGLSDDGVFVDHNYATVSLTMTNNEINQCDGDGLQWDTDYRQPAFLALHDNSITHNDEDGIEVDVEDVIMFFYMEGNDISWNDQDALDFYNNGEDRNPSFWLAFIDNTMTHNDDMCLDINSNDGNLYGHFEGNDMSYCEEYDAMEIDVQGDAYETKLWIIDNTFTNNEDDVLDQFASHDAEIWFIGNTMTDHVDGGIQIDVDDALYFWFEANTYTNMDEEIELDADENAEITIFDNVISEVQDEEAFDIDIQDTLWLDIHDNVVTDVENDGFEIDAGSDDGAFGRFYNNIVTDCGVVNDDSGLDAMELYPWGLQIDNNRFEDNGDFGVEIEDLKEPLLAHSGTHAWHAGMDSYTHEHMRMDADLTTVTGEATLTFWHWLDGNDDSNDGGFVEVNSGNGWERITPKHGYDGTGNCYGLTLPDGTNGGCYYMDTTGTTAIAQDWEFEEFDLTPWAGHNVVVRWSWGADNFERRGWYIDDIELSIDGTVAWTEDGEGEAPSPRVGPLNANGPGQIWFDDDRFVLEEFFTNDIFTNDFIGNLEGGLYLYDTMSIWSDTYETRVFDNYFYLNGVAQGAIGPEEWYYGLTLREATADVFGNDFAANSEGCLIYNSDVNFHDNTLTQNNFDGLEITQSGFWNEDYPVTVQDNVFTSNSIGLNIRDQSQVTLINNDFLSNYNWGLWVDDDRVPTEASYVEWWITGTSTVKNNAVYWYGGSGETIRDADMNPGNIVVKDGGTLIAKDNKLFAFACSDPGEWALIVETGGMLDAHDNNFRSWYMDELSNQTPFIANINQGSNALYQLNGPILTEDRQDYARFGDTSLEITGGIIMTEVPWGTEMDSWGQYQVNYETSQIRFFIGQGGASPGGVNADFWTIDDDRDYWRFRIYGSAMLDGNEIEDARTIYIEEGFSATRADAGMESETVIIRENEIYDSYYGGIYSIDSDPEIFLNEIYNSNYGIYYEGGMVDVTQNNWIHDITADAIHMEDCTGTISGNTFDDNREGVVGYRCEGVVVHDNDFTGHVKDAIHFVDSNGTEIHHNLVDTTADKGVYIDSSTNTVMNDNEYTWNYYGLYVSNADVEVTNDVFMDSARDDIYADKGAMVSLYDVDFDWEDRLTVLQGGQVDVYYTVTVHVETPMGLPIGGVAVTIDPESGDPLNGETDSEGQYPELLMVASFDGTQTNLADAFEVISVTATSGAEEATFDGSLDESLMVVLVLDFAPTVADTVTDAFTLEEDQELTEIFNLMDLFVDDGDPADLVYSIETSANVNAVVDETGLVTITPRPNWNGEENITITVSDGVEGHEVALEITITVTAVQDIPVIEELSLDPVDPNNGDDLILTFTLRDVDMVPRTYSESAYGNNPDLNGTQIRWYRNGDQMEMFDDQIMVSSDYTNPGEVWYVTVKPHDGEDYGAVVMSGEVTIINVKPDLEFRLTADMINIDPPQPMAGDTLTVFVDTGLRTQYDPFLYQWNRNGVPIEGATGDMLASDYLTKGDVITVTVTPTDGWNVGDPVTSANLKILNTPPVLDEVMVTPLEAYMDSTLTAVPVGFADVDPDDYTEYIEDTARAHRTFRYQWYRQVLTTSGSGNNTTTEMEWIPITGATGMTLDSDAFNKGDVVCVMVTPYDGEGYGIEYKSPNVEIRNSAPTLKSVSIIPATATANVDLQAIPSGYFDLDGDDSRYYFRWYDLEGLLFQGWGTQGGNTLDQEHVEEGAVIYVIVVPNDGRVNGTAVTSQSVQVASDSDNDGLPDGIDHDSDNDGYADELEEAYGSDPYDNGSSPNDLDGDGVPDQEDVDIDGDGVLNDRDAFPMDPAASKDMDGDGRPDSWNAGADGDDSTTGLELDDDMDGDGIGNDDDDFPSNPAEWQDTDGDGIGDNVDPDANGDGIPDSIAQNELETEETAAQKAADNAEERNKILWYFFVLLAVILILIVLIIMIVVFRREQEEAEEESYMPLEEEEMIGAQVDMDDDLLDDEEMDDDIEDYDVDEDEDLDEDDLEEDEEDLDEGEDDLEEDEEEIEDDLDEIPDDDALDLPDEDIDEEVELEDEGEDAEEDEDKD